MNRIEKLEKLVKNLKEVATKEDIELLWLAIEELNSRLDKMP